MTNSQAVVLQRFQKVVKVLSLAVENGYKDYYAEHIFFDPSYASAGATCAQR